MERMKILLIAFIKMFLIYSALIAFVTFMSGVGAAWKAETSLILHIQTSFEIFWPLIIPSAFIIAAVQLFILSR